VWTHCLGNKKEAKTDTAKSETRKPGNYDTRKLEPWETKKPGDQETKLSGKRPQTVWGSGRIMYANVDDDDGAEIYRQNAAPHFTRAILYKNFTIRATLSRNLQEKCCAPESAQNADTHFVRACAVDMHVNISQ